MDCPNPYFELNIYTTLPEISFKYHFFHLKKKRREKFPLLLFFLKFLSVQTTPTTYVHVQELSHHISRPLIHGYSASHEIFIKLRETCVLCYLVEN